MSKELLVAGVDTSTQSCKIVVRELESGRLVRSGNAAHPDGTECHPDHWWDAFKEAVKMAGGLDDVVAISVGGQQHGMVLLDEDGEIIRPALLWNDTRSAIAAEDLIAELGAEIVRESPAAAKDGAHLSEIGAKHWAQAIGSVLVASITITKLRWLAAAEPENAKRIKAVCLPHDWLSWRLAGYGPKSQGYTPDFDKLYTDRSDASGTGYFDATANGGKGEYRRDLLDLALRPAGITSENIILPKVLQASEHTVVGEYAEQLLPVGTLIGPGGGDNAAAAFGLGLRTGEVSVSLGTSGVVAAVSATPTADPTGAVNGFADCTGNYLPLACTLNASRDIDAGCKILGVGYDEFSDLALKAPEGAEGITLVPYFEGERMPNRPTANASLFGLTLSNAKPENIARAFIEGMLLGQNDGIAKMQEMGVMTRKVLMIGGSMKSPAVRAIAPAIFQRDITLPSLGEYVADGAARQAGWVYNVQNNLNRGDAPYWELASEEVIKAPATPDVVDAYNKVKDLPTKGELLTEER